MKNQGQNSKLQEPKSVTAPLSKTINLPESNKSDYMALAELVLDDEIRDSLADLVQMARDSSDDPDHDSCYRKLSPVFCDGYEVSL